MSILSILFLDLLHIKGDFIEKSETLFYRVKEVIAHLNFFFVGKL